MHPSELFEQPPNVKELGLEIEHPRSTYEFDVEKEIPEAVVDELEQEIELARKQGDWREVADRSAKMVKLNPERVQALLKDSDWEGMAELMHTYSGSTGLEKAQMAYMARLMLTINPERAITYFTDADRVILEQHHPTLRSRDWQSFLQSALVLCQLAPEQSSDFLLDSDRERINTVLDTLRLQENYADFMYYASQFGTICPDAVRSMVTVTDWENAVTKFRVLRKPGTKYLYEYFGGSLAVMAKILNATEPTVQVDSNQELPVTKNF